MSDRLILALILFLVSVGLIYLGRLGTKVQRIQDSVDDLKDLVRDLSDDE